MEEKSAKLLSNSDEAPLVASAFCEAAASFPSFAFCVIVVVHPHLQAASSSSRCAQFHVEGKRVFKASEI